MGVFGKKRSQGESDTGKAKVPLDGQLLVSNPLLKVTRTSWEVGMLRHCFGISQVGVFGKKRSQGESSTDKANIPLDGQLLVSRPLSQK